MVKAAYFRACLAGIDYKDLPVIQLAEAERELSSSYASRGEPKYVPLNRFLEHWVNPGFTFRNIDSYLVRADRTMLLDQMQLGFDYGRQRNGLHEDIKKWLSYNSIVDEWIGDVFDNLVNRVDLPHQMRDRLHLFIESDSVIKEQFSKNLPEEENICLISRDVKLGANLVRIGEARGREYHVYVLRPLYHLVGRTYEIPELTESFHLIEDPGAINYDTIKHMMEGAPPDWIWDTELTPMKTRFRNVWVIDYNAQCRVRS